MKKIWLVTGSAGFIGSNLVQHLLSCGEYVIGVDNLSTGRQQNVDRVISQSDGRYNFVVGDICDENVVASCFKSSPNIVVHLAAQGSVQKSFDDFGFNNRQNILGFTNILKASGEQGVERFIYASSCAVYGEVNDLPVKESHCAAPLSPYASSKLFNDYLSSNLVSRYPYMLLIGLRFFNIFGPWQDPAGDYAAVIPKWIDRCLAGRRPIVFGDGSATRDFCYVGNVCKLIESIGLGAMPASSRSGTFYNVSSGVGTSLNELFEAIVGALRRRGVDLDFDYPVYKPWRVGDIIHSLGSIERARTELGFSPRVDLVEGIDRILSEQYGLG